MSNKDEAVTKEFIVPEALSVGYSFGMFVEYVVDRVPEFQSVTGVRKGIKLIEAVEAAEKDVDHIVRWPTELWKCVCKTLESEQFQMPRNFILRNGEAGPLVPLRAYLPLVEAILQAVDKVAPKSEVAAPKSSQETTASQATEESADTAAA